MLAVVDLSQAVAVLLEHLELVQVAQVVLVTSLPVVLAQLELEHHSVAVEAVMTKEVVAIAPDASTADAAGLLVRHDISRMPVVDGEEVVGIIDRHDLLKGLVF